jgi:FkbM family methyltransferase
MYTLKNSTGQLFSKRLKNIIKSIIVTTNKFINKNYVTFTYGGDEFRYYYNEETIGIVYGLIEDEKIKKENIPLSVLIPNRKVDALFDIGAHYGVYTVIMGLLNTNSDIYAFEPDEKNRSVLFDMLTENEVKANVKKEVVSDEQKVIKFYIEEGKSSVGHSTEYKEGSIPTKKKSIALSEVIENEDIDSAYVKIDSEGEEYNIIRDIIQTDLPYLEGIVEIHPDKMSANPSKLIKLLEKECSECSYIAESSPEYKYDRPIYYFRR